MAHFRSEARIDILVLESFTREVLPVGVTSFIVFFSFTDPSFNPYLCYYGSSNDETEQHNKLFKQA